MPLPSLIAGLLLAILGVQCAAAREPDEVQAVAPGGPGVLTKCRDWVVTSSCKTYHHIELPARVAVGDKLTLTFGSSPKEYAFLVARIAAKGRHCAIFSEAEGDRHQMDKINVAPCYRAKEEGR
jgi:hypothetical protein